MIIDISSYNGTIDFETLIKENVIERIIMRSTLKSGEPDPALSVDISKLKKVDDSIPIDFYKFTYAKNYADAVLEATELLYTLKAILLLKIPETIYIDIEQINGKVFGKTAVQQCQRQCHAFERAEAFAQTRNHNQIFLPAAKANIIHFAIFQTVCFIFNGSHSLPPSAGTTAVSKIFVMNLCDEFIQKISACPSQQTQTRADGHGAE